MEVKNKSRKHLDPEDIEGYLRFEEYSKHIKDWGERSKFKRACKNLSVENGHFFVRRNV